LTHDGCSSPCSNASGFDSRMTGADATCAPDNRMPGAAPPVLPDDVITIGKTTEQHWRLNAVPEAFDHPRDGPVGLTRDVPRNIGDVFVRFRLTPP